MEPEFITYKKFNDIVLANELTALLEAHDIRYQVEESSLTPNPLFALNDEVSKEYSIKISPDNFEKVNELLKQRANEDIGEVEKDYYLFDFTDSELKDVVIKSDEWNAFDVQLARKLLAERGENVSDDEIAELEAERIEALKVTEPRQTFWIVLGYLFALAGGVLGFFIGWYISTYKRTLPNGERLYVYSESDRKQGRIIFYLSFVGLAVIFIIKLLPVFSGDN